MTFQELAHAYFSEHLIHKADYSRAYRRAKQWLFTLDHAPTREEIKIRHKSIGHGDKLPGAAHANKELGMLRALFRWGVENKGWSHDPTAGIKKFKTKKRTRIARFNEIRALLDFFDFCERPTDLRDRALYGIALLTGCRPSEVRMAQLSAITKYGDGGCWNKGVTKNGEEHVVPIPSQAMSWLSDWLQARGRDPRYRTSSWIFPGQNPSEPISDSSMRKSWARLGKELNMEGLWNYDLRRTLSSYLSNELNIPDKKIQAILNHYDGRALSHYCHVSFDALVPIMQQYAEWLFSLRQLSPSLKMTAPHDKAAHAEKGAICADCL